MKVFAHLALAAAIVGADACAETLFADARTAHVAGDNRASRVGDILTVVVYQNAEARSAAGAGASRRSGIDAALKGGSVAESRTFAVGSDFNGRGEVRRSESFITQISVAVVEVLDSGDLVVAGSQRMRINGERTDILVRGRVRQADITGDNQVLSTRIADAEFSYAGAGGRATRSSVG